MSAAAREPWYVAAFRSTYQSVYAHRDVEAAAREVAWILEQGIHGRVLDLCCGFGRHSLAFARAGIDIVGMDLSADLLESSTNLPEAERLRGRLMRADVRRLPYMSASFDSLVNLFSSFGYFGAAGDMAVLDEIARVLKPGGRALLDLMNPDRIRAGLVPRSVSERAGLTLIEERRLADDGRRVQKDVRVEHPDGRVEEWREDVRMYSNDELRAATAERGLELLRTDGGFDGSAYGPHAERQILHLRRT